MLQTNTVEPHTLQILKELMALRELSDFVLVGGTSLALQFGHRYSEDLDLFSDKPFENIKIAEILQKNFPGFTYRNLINPVGIFGYIDHIKVDLIKHQNSPFIKEYKNIDGIRLASLNDIMAMKISAIMKRAERKDFFDLAELLKHFSVDEIILNYNKKYSNQQLLISVPQAMVWFDEAEESVSPKSLNGQNWESVKKFIQRKVREYLK